MAGRRNGRSDEERPALPPEDSERAGGAVAVCVIRRPSFCRAAAPRPAGRDRRRSSGEGPLPNESHPQNGQGPFGGELLARGGGQWFEMQ
jgi:hypothetical protein